MTNSKFLSLVVLSTVLAVMNSTVRTQAATVDFESLPLGTQFGGSPPPLSDSPGDLVFTENGIGVHVDNFTLGVFVGFNNVTIGGFTDSSFPTTPATVNNILLDFDISGLGGPVTSASFEYADFGGDENLVVNGVAHELNDFPSAPAVIAGVNVSVTPPVGPSVIGLVTLTGPITGLAIGGQELGIDNVTFRVVPEPASISLLAILTGLAILRRQRS